jgi:hypothetical protein
MRNPNRKIASHNSELHRLYKKVDQLSDEDQPALVIVLDSLVSTRKGESSLELGSPL